MNALELALHAERNATKLARSSLHHGPAHWRDVARLGAVISCFDREVDPLVVFLFGAFHDTQRRNEFEDPDHGKRAATEVARLYDAGRLGLLTARQAEQLLGALIGHNQPGRVSGDPTIGACFDADRLTLSRVGTTPHVRYMSHPAVVEHFKGFRKLGFASVHSADTDWPSVALACGLLTL